MNEVINVTKYLTSNHLAANTTDATRQVLAGNVYIDNILCTDPKYCLGESRHLTHERFGNVISIKKKSAENSLAEFFGKNISVYIEIYKEDGYYGVDTEVTVKVYLGGVLVFTERQTH